jgi:hypothetical protein
VLAGVLIAGAAVRFWGLQFGLPHTLAQADESLVARTAVDVARGHFNPGFFNYPSLFIYVTGAAYATRCAAQALTGRFGSFTACTDSWPTEWEPFFLIARAISAAFGTLTIWLVFRLGLHVFDRAAALAGSLFMAFAFLHVRDSHFGVTDTTMTALTVAAVLALARADERPVPRRFLAAGVLAGLAASTKYNGLLLAAPALSSQLWAWKSGEPVRACVVRALLFGCAMLGAFLLGTPFAVLDWPRFWADATSEAAHLASGHGILLGIGWRHHVLVNLWHGLTWPLLVAGLTGACWAVVRMPRRAALLLSFPVVYYLVAGRGYTVFARYMLPEIPFLCLTAGFFVAGIAGRMERRGSPARTATFAAALSVVIVASTVWKTVALDRLLARADSRVLAAAWLDEHLADRSSVYVSGARYGMPDLSQHGRPTRYAIWQFDESRGGFDAPSGPTGDWPQWIVLQESPLTMYSGTASAVQAGLSKYDRRVTFRAVDTRQWHVYDQQDAFFLPLAGFSGVGRPGPNLSIYERKSP